MEAAAHDLRGMRVMALHSTALAEGVGAEAVEAAMDEDDPRAALIALLETAPSSASASGGAGAEAEAARLVELLVGDAEARQRGYAELESADAAVAAEPSVVDALVEGVLCSAQVESGEYRQVCGLVGAMMLRKEGGFDLEMIRQQRWIRAWEAPALLAAAAKPPAEMTRDDALTAGLSAMPLLVLCAKSFTHIHALAGEDEMASLSRLPTNPLFPDRAAANPGSDKRLTQLVLELLRDPKGLDDLQVASLWFSLFCIMCQRPELGVVTANGGIFEIGVAELRES